MRLFGKRRKIRRTQLIDLGNLPLREAFVVLFDSAFAMKVESTAALTTNDVLVVIESLADGLVTQLTIHDFTNTIVSLKLRLRLASGTVSL